MATRSPEYCSGLGVLHREQKVELFDVGEVRLEFTINSRPFVLTTTELKGGDRTWPLTHAPTEVDVDALQ
ncbi:MAG: hypothetical protein U0746_15215 [Gemmataceae bacterium]